MKYETATTIAAATTTSSYIRRRGRMEKLQSGGQRWGFALPRCFPTIHIYAPIIFHPFYLLTYQIRLIYLPPVIFMCLSYSTRFTYLPIIFVLFIYRPLHVCTCSFYLFTCHIRHIYVPIIFHSVILIYLPCLLYVSSFRYI